VPKHTLEIAGCHATREELTRLLSTLEEETRLSRTARRAGTVPGGHCRVAAGLEGEVAALQKQIMEAGGSEWKVQQAACKQKLAAFNCRRKGFEFGQAVLLVQ
jgi:hypothetical protein